MDDGGQSDSEPDNLFEVKTINGKRINNGVEEYLVEWVGYNEMTWEPKEHLENISSMIKLYEKSIQRKAESNKSGSASSYKMTSDHHSSSNGLFSKNISNSSRPSVLDDSESMSQSSEDQKTQKSIKGSSHQMRPERFQEFPSSRGGYSVKNSFKPQKKKKEVQTVSEDGSFAQGDKPLTILEWWIDKSDFKNEQFKIIFIVEWKKRSKGLRPRPSAVDHIQMREYASSLLLDFYESRISIEMRGEEF